MSTHSAVIGSAPAGGSTWNRALDRALLAILGFVLLVACFVPYVSPVALGFDTQPYALLLAAVLTGLFVRRAVPPPLLALFIPFLLAPFLVAEDGFSFRSLRSLANYASIALIPYVSYLTIRWDRTLFRRALRFAIYLWLAAALVQLLVGKEVLAFLMPDVRTTGLRGVTSVSPEPTHYGMQCVFFFLLVLMEFRGRERVWLASLLILQILLLAQSTMAALVLLGIAGLLLLTLISTPRRFLIAVIVALVLGGGVFVALRYLSGEVNSRLVYLALALVENPRYLLLVDQSGNARFASIFISHLGFVEHGMIPHGFGAYADYVLAVVPQFGELTAHANRADRIMSGYGSALFELGLAGLLIPVLITIIFWRAFGDRPRRFILYCVPFHVTLLLAVPLANPVVGASLGYVAATAAGKRTNSG